MTLLVEVVLSVSPDVLKKAHVSATSCSRRGRLHTHTHTHTHTHAHTLEFTDATQQVHRFASNKELAERFDTVEKLLHEPDIQRWVEWVSTQVMNTSFTFLALFL